MSYFYIKALHIIFIVTWFSGLFYIVRLFIYNREALDKPSPEKEILQNQFNIMIRRLWLGITWPSAVLTLIFGLWTLMYFLSANAITTWLWVKLSLVLVLFLYHFTLHAIYKQQSRGDFRYSSMQLRYWNEVATLLLIAIVFLVVLKDFMPMSTLLYILAGLVTFIVVVTTLYKKARS